MVDLKDPTRDALIRELRLFRRGHGWPTAARMAGLFTVTEILGDGIPQRAFDELKALHDRHGTDPETDIGAFFYLSGWDTGRQTIEQRRLDYMTLIYAGSPSTAWRRSDRGLAELAGLIRDRDEHTRPWAFVSIFQSHDRYQPVLDFNLGIESWQNPAIYIDGEPVPDQFIVRHDPDNPERYTRRLVLPESTLDLTAGFGEPMANLRVEWAMPVWPAWGVFSWTADPRIATYLRTFRERAVEVSLQWWRQTPPAEVQGLVGDGSIWTEHTDPNKMNLPDGWRVQ